MIPKPIAYLAQESSSPTQARRAINAGFKSIAVRIGIVTDEAVKVAKDAGLHVAAWGPVDSNSKLPAGVDSFIPQVEGQGQFEGALAALHAGVGKGLPIAVVTTYGGMYDIGNPRSGDRWQQLAALGVTECQVECYDADGYPHADLDRMLSQGEVYGIPKAALVAIVGTYAGEFPSDYSGLTLRAPNYGIYILEETGDTQLAAFATLQPPTVVAPTAPVLPNPADVNAQISRLAHTWLDPHEGDDRLSRLRSIDRIANTTDTEWVNARAAVIKALDSVGA